jgi:hypothetical protein
MLVINREWMRTFVCLMGALILSKESGDVPSIASLHPRWPKPNNAVTSRKVGVNFRQQVATQRRAEAAVAKLWRDLILSRKRGVFRQNRQVATLPDGMCCSCLRFRGQREVIPNASRQRLTIRRSLQSFRTGRCFQDSGAHRQSRRMQKLCR